MPTPMTLNGAKALREEVAYRKGALRQEITQAIAEARAHGDLKENAEYHAAREKQSFIEGRISELEDVTSRAEVIDASQLSGDKVTFGTSVGLADEEADEETTYHIVGPYEADISKGMISTSSPIARAVIGKAVGDSAEVQSPGGTKSFEIISIELFDISKVSR